MVSRRGTAAAHPVEEVRNTDAWVMGQDTNGPGFHEVLLKMLNDPSPMVRGKRHYLWCALEILRVARRSLRCYSQRR